MLTAAISVPSLSACHSSLPLRGRDDRVLDDSYSMTTLLLSTYSIQLGQSLTLLTLRVSCHEICNCLQSGCICHIEYQRIAAC